MLPLPTLRFSRNGAAIQASCAPVFCCVVLLSSCSGTGEAPDRAEEAEEQTAVVVQDTGFSDSGNEALLIWRQENAFRWMNVTPDRPVLPKHVACIRDDFKKYFTTNPDALPPTTLTKPDIKIDWEGLVDEMEHVTVTGTQKRAVLVHHGLVKVGASYRYAPGISLVKIVPGTGAYYWDLVVGANPFYTINATNGSLVPAAYSTWNGWTLYVSVMHLKRNSDDAAFAKIEVGTDVETYLLPYENELALLIAHNSGAVAVAVKLVSTAEPEKQNDPQMTNLAHHLCAVALDASNNELLAADNPPANRPFQGRGADIGSACPPNCAPAYLPLKGVDVRADCL